MRTFLTAFFSRPWVLATLTGLCLAASFAPLDLGWLAFVALIPLLIALKGQRAKAAFRLGHWAGFISFALIYDWMTVFAVGKGGAVGAVSAIVLAAIMAIFTGLWALSSAIVINSPRIAAWAKPSVIASLMVIIDYIRQLGSLGMGWGDIGYTQWRNTILMHIAPIAGIWGMTWAVALVNATIALKDGARVVGIAAVGLFICVVSGVATNNVKSAGLPYVAAALQANIDQDVPWDGNRPEDPAYYEMTMNTFANLARQASAKGAKLCVTAETSIPGYLDSDPDIQNRLNQIASVDKLDFIAGGREHDYLSGEDKNVLALFDGSSQIPTQSVMKQQLVPFGEFVPFQNQIGWISVLRVASFNMEAGGESQAPLNTGSALGKIGVAVCYDATYPRCIRYQLRHGADILAVGSDDTWFGRTSQSRQSEAINAVRAAESDRYLVRCSATGISAIIDNNGRIIAQMPLFTQGALTATVQPLVGQTLFIRYGDWWIAVCVFLIALTAASARHKREAKPL